MRSPRTARTVIATAVALIGSIAWWRTRDAPEQPAPPAAAVQPLNALIDSAQEGASRVGAFLLWGRDTVAILNGVSRYPVSEVGRPTVALVYEGGWTGRAFYLPAVPDSTAAMLVDSSAGRILIRLAPIDSAREAGMLAGLVVLHRPERELKLFR